MPPTETDLLIRPAGPDDAAALAEVHLASRAAAPMPPAAHPPDGVRAWLAARLDSDDEVWVAEDAGDVVAYLRMTATWLDDLYVAPSHAGQGVGSVLLDLAKARRPDGFSLWVFESNTPARAFYRRHGLVEREHTDGSENEERAPDLRMAWEPAA
ncbi:GNAT family N-acetyltransferase [Nocardioides dongxiaopingii]|uniref:GNAT family N-acetyltransferase n=1 Tax=Nocardioides TaxID=1839 RepID=UPI001BB0BE3C|nr:MULTISPECIES: GNAT family N-acetyltransferase [Nocardioides]